MAPLPRRGQQVRPSEREVVLVRSSSSMPWGLQLEYQLYRTPEDSREWGCFAVVECARGSPASLQLRIGDLLVGVDGRKVKSSSRDDFAELLSTLHSKGRAVFFNRRLKGRRRRSRGVRCEDLLRRRRRRRPPRPRGHRFRRHPRQVPQLRRRRSGPGPGPPAAKPPTKERRL
mmetsp:Transcript_14232/g.46444  ORF Transcript_14232/g.46444 Transcript_14232/m.46444 type:complete len:173 (-) Transcript_14232:245-763(-)